MTRRFDRKGYQREMGRCTGTRKYGNGKIGRCDHPSHGCFPGDAKVLTPAGYVRMDSFVPGSLVTTYGPGNVLTVSRVKKLVSYAKTVISEVSFSDSSQILRVTSHHSLCTENGEWLQVRNLRPGMYLRTVDGGREIADIVARAECEPVYNLYPFGNKTFIVNGFIAHSFTHFRATRTFLHSVMEAVTAGKSASSEMRPA
jgi:hypothetical protein